MPMTTTGKDRTLAIQNRRVMSTSSVLGPLCSDGVSGSSAIPQIGHEPGPI